MNAPRIPSRSRLLCAAAMAVASLAATGCAAPADPAPEPTAEAEARLVSHRHTALGLIQVHDIQGDLVGYGYTEAIGTGKSLQRWLLFSNAQGNDLTFRPYNPDDDPEELGAIVVEDLGGWEQLVGALWNDADWGTNMIYAMCISQVYEHGGTYGDVIWKGLPSSPPLTQFPSWEPTAERWTPFAPLPVTPQPTPLVWPPTNGWLQASAPPVAIQLDPGDGKVFQQGLQQDIYVQNGIFFALYGVMAEVSTEYFFMGASYSPAGTPDQTYNIGNGNPQWGSLELFWSEVETRWVPDTAIAINGCVNYHHAELPTPL